jgi:hypothetical protein
LHISDNDSQYILKKVLEKKVGHNKTRFYINFYEYWLGKRFLTILDDLGKTIKLIEKLWITFARLLIFEENISLRSENQKYHI